MAKDAFNSENFTLTLVSPLKGERNIETMFETITRSNPSVSILQEKILQEGGAAPPTLLINFPFPMGRGLSGWETKTPEALNI
jgi:hypothetical protein